jgi:hypothetical protein
LASFSFSGTSSRMMAMILLPEGSSAGTILMRTVVPFSPRIMSTIF